MPQITKPAPAENDKIASTKLQFFVNNFDQILLLETELRIKLGDSELQKNPIIVVKMLDGGWLPFKQAFGLQSVFKEEKTFFQALNFIKRVEICQTVQKNKPLVHSAENLVVKLT